VPLEYGLTCDLVRRATLASGYHDEQLHDGVIDLGTPGLDDKDVLLSHAGEDPHTCLALIWWLVRPDKDAMTAWKHASGLGDC